jgi:hypothetical protein
MRSIFVISPTAVVFLTLSIFVRKGLKEISLAVAKIFPIENIRIPEAIKVEIE